jgi:hypothetical protein
MKRTSKLIAFLLIFTLISSCLFPAMISYAEDEDEYYDDTDFYDDTIFYDDTDDSDDTADESEDSEEASGDAVDPLGGYKGLVAHWKFDGDLKDSSQFGNDGVVVGGRNGVTFVDGVLNSGVKLDGKSYIEVNDSDSLDLMNAFTFSFWVYKEDMRKKDMMDGGVPYIIKNNDEDCEFPYGVYEWWDLTPGITFSDEDSVYDVNSEKQVDIQKWTLITVTYDSKTMKIYQDKRLVKSELESVSLIRSSQPLYIGFGHFMTVDNFFKGILDDMRIYNKALSYSEIEDLYDNVVSSQNPGEKKVNKPKELVAYYKFNGDLKDASSFKNDGIAVNSKGGIKYDYAYAGKCAIFNGASYVEVKDSDSLDLDRGFTISAWLYKEKNKTNQPILAKYGESHDKKNTSYSITDWGDGTAQRLSLTDFDAEGEVHNFDIDDSNATADGRWFYYTATYNGKSEEDEEENKDDNTVKIYINGKLISTQEFDGDISNSSRPLWIGADEYDGTFFKGKMDELRIYNYALSPTEIKRDMNIKDSLTFDADSLKKINSLALNQTAQLKVSRRNVNDGKSFDVTEKSVYKSSNTKVLTVSKGTVKAVGKGKATITATYGLISNSIKNVSVK